MQQGLSLRPLEGLGDLQQPAPTRCRLKGLGYNSHVSPGLAKANPPCIAAAFTQPLCAGLAEGCVNLVQTGKATDAINRLNLLSESGRTSRVVPGSCTRARVKRGESFSENTVKGKLEIPEGT